MKKKHIYYLITTMLSLEPVVQPNELPPIIPNYTTEKKPLDTIKSSSSKIAELSPKSTQITETNIDTVQEKKSQFCTPAIITALAFGVISTVSITLYLIKLYLSVKNFSNMDVRDNDTDDE